MDFIVLVFVFAFVAPRVLILDKARGVLWLAASVYGGGRPGGRSRRGWVPAGGLFCAAICVLAAGAPPGLVARRAVLAEAWCCLGAACLARAPWPCRMASLELLGLWEALVVWGSPLGLGEAVVGTFLATALPALFSAGCRALEALHCWRRAAAARAPDTLNTESSAMQAAA